MLTADDLLAAYRGGYFPMADNRNAKELYWYSPEHRGIIPLDGFHVPRSLQKFMRHCPYEVTFDTAFTQVIQNCADVKTERRKDTWINDEIIALYGELHERNFAHSVECWKDKKLVGGLYGVSIGGAFFGESMFSFATNASKIALIHLVDKLRAAGYILLDTQYINEHLLQFGVIEIARENYLEILENALKVSPNPSMRFLIASDIIS